LKYEFMLAFNLVNAEIEKIIVSDIGLGTCNTKSHCTLSV